MSLPPTSKSQIHGEKRVRDRSEDVTTVVVTRMFLGHTREATNFLSWGDRLAQAQTHMVALFC